MTEIIEEGIKKSHEALDPDWTAILVSAVEWCAKEFQYFTTDDVWMYISNYTVAFPHPSALGHQMRLAVKNSLIERTGDFQESKRPAAHRRPLRVWRSLVHPKRNL